MAKWNKLIITDAGYQLSAQTLAGNKIQYTHAQTTDKDMSTLTSDQLKTMTSLDNVVQDLPIGTVSVQDDHTVNVPVKVMNNDLQSDYLLSAIALFAKTIDGTEILYGIATSVNPDLIPAQNGSTVVGTTFKLKVHVGDAANVNIVISPDGSVSNEELEGILKAYVLETDLDALLQSKNYASKDYVDDAIKNNKVTLPDNIDYVDQDQTITGAKTFSTDAKGADGSSYITANASNAWQKYKLTADTGKAINYSGNVNDLKTPGQYFVKNPAHVPDTGAWWFVDVKVSPDAGTSVIHQSGHGDNYDMFWERTCRNGVWSAWAKRISGVDLENRLATFAQTITDSIMAKIVDPNTGQAKIKMNFNYGDLTVDTDPVAPIVKVADEAAATTREATHPNTQHEWGEE
ncbi:pyocin knob domain-containing protein [Lentilactobacillus sp. SPB1-3]|uniref:Pyocin knob domain-containing protein n=1 Tax=Lentilactobacillus terminaliae TaxID=3003483 RepID=A0ACD5DD54_9LACO|nr:pyocin knob domain-containing protein [Lentilactobacillus sp. SPB1-3]MCZ0978104.1 pyocin knob domain-containing protein [Lentilactobacillus sp. SPB1-3]